MSSFREAEKLKALKLKLKNWNKEIFGRSKERKIQALKKVAFWDTLGAQRPLTQDELRKNSQCIPNPTH